MDLSDIFNGVAVAAPVIEVANCLASSAIFNVFSRLYLYQPYNFYPHPEAVITKKYDAG